MSLRHRLLCTPAEQAHLPAEAGPRRRATLALALICASVAYLALIATSAQAIQTHYFLKSFGSGHLGNPIGIAVDNSSTPSQGDIYIANPGGTVQKYDSSGNLITSYGDTSPSPDGRLHGTALPGGAFSTLYNVAVDPSNGDLYVVDRGARTVDKFDSSGNLITSFGDTSPSHDGQLHGTAAAGFFAPWALAVDPSTHNLYVGDTVSGGKVDVFNSSGAFQASLSFAGVGETVSFGLDSLGHVYVASYYGVKVYDASTGNLDPSYGGGSGTLVSGTFLNGLAVDPTTDHVYVGQDGFISEWDSSGNLVDTFGADASPALGHYLFGVSVDAVTQRIYVSDYENSVADVFGPGVTLPNVNTKDASNISHTTATVNGNVDPDAAHGGGPVTDCHFEYGTDTTYSLGSVPCSQATPYSAPTDVSADLSGLTSETTYHYRLVAANADGPAPGADHTFTPRAVYSLATGSSSNPEPGSATLNGSFTGDGNDTHYYFEYVDNGNYVPTAPDPYSAGQTTAAPPGADAGSGTGTQNVSAIANFPSPYTTYHYRIVATNGFGTSYGSDQTLFTLPPVLPAIDATSSSNVTPVSATLDAQVKPGFGPTIVRFEYGTTTSYGSRTYPTESIGDDNADHPASIDISGLTPGTTYHFRALATNFTGIVKGPDQAFTTPDLPAVSGEAASNLTSTTATLNATIKPGFRSTTYHFEYGIADAYGHSTSESPPIGSDNSVHPGSATISGLQPETTYHFRILATNAIGTTAGPDQTFTTAPVVTPLPPPPFTCKHGFVKRHGKCVRKHHHKRKHHRRSH
jgi:hypothetical protein